MINAREARLQAEKNAIKWKKWNIWDYINEIDINSDIKYALKYCSGVTQIEVRRLRDNVAEKLKREGYRIEILTTIPTPLKDMIEEYNKEGNRISTYAESITSRYIKGYTIKW